MSNQQISTEQTPDTTPDASPAPVVQLLQTPHISYYFERGFVPLQVRGVRVNLLTVDARADLLQPHLLIPLPRTIAPLYLEGNISVYDLARCLGHKTIDPAIPIGWIRQNYTARGLPFPMGVWSYDRMRVSGEFISFDQLLEQLADLLLMAVWSGELAGLPNPMIYHPNQFPLNYSPRVIKPGDRLVARSDYHQGKYWESEFICLGILEGGKINATPAPVAGEYRLSNDPIYALEHVNGVWYLPHDGGSVA